MVLTGKVGVVTGAAGNLGLAAARLFLEQGARVMLVDKDASSLRAALERLESNRASSAIADVTRASDVEAYAAATEKAFGKIDLFFNNAGIEGKVCPLTEYPDDVFDQVMAVNVKGVYLGLKHVLPRMNDGGSVIITSSVAARRGTPAFVAYAASKHAVVGIMQCAALEAAPRRIRINTIHPGMVESAMMERLHRQFAPAQPAAARESFQSAIKLGRYVRPDEVAQLVLFLASDSSTMVTGSEFVIDGGFLL